MGGTAEAESDTNVAITIARRFWNSFLFMEFSFV